MITLSRHDHAAHVALNVHLLDYNRIGQLEDDLYHQRFHHESRRCMCKRCVRDRVDRDTRLAEQTRHGWEITTGTVTRDG